MACESDNNLFGNASNPHDGSRTAGGSSGGEAALIANSSVNCAIGSDIAGSLRIPAMFCGIYSLKPTAGRFADVEENMAVQWSNFAKTGDLQPIIQPTCGPMAKSAKDIEMLAFVMNSYHSVDVTLPPVPWKSVDLPTRIGVIRGFPKLLEPFSATSRALQMAVDAYGAEAVEIDLNDLIEEMVVGSMSCFFKDAQLAKLVRGQVGLGEPLVDAFAEFRKLLTAPVFLLRLLQSTSAFSAREKIYVRAYLASLDNNSQALEFKQRKMKEEVLKRFKAAGVEVVFAPGLFPSILKHTSKDCDLFCFYCFIWNYLNFPVGAVPVTKVLPAEEQGGYQSKFEDKITKTLRLNIQGSAGLPVGVQIVGLPWREELVVEVMKKLEPAMDDLRIPVKH